jgi:hypothetical protein
MLDHVFISVSDLGRSIDFYTAALAPLGITTRVDYDGNDGPPGHPDLKGFGANGRIFFWLRHGQADSRATHVGFVADSEAQVDAAHPQRGSTTTPATTPPMCSIRTAIASNSSTRVGSTDAGPGRRRLTRGYGNTLHNASSAPAHALSEGVA